MSQKERYAGLIEDFEYLESCIRDLKACINRYDEGRIEAEEYSQKESNLRNHVEYYAREILRDLFQSQEKELAMPQELEDFADLI